MSNLDHDTVWRRLADTRFFMLTVTLADGELAAQPMTLQRLDADQRLWFFTAADTTAATAIARQPQVNLAVMHDNDSFYVSLAGRAQLVRDRAAIDELWNPLVKAWFPQGRDDPRLTLLVVQVEHGEYWADDASQMVQFFRMAKAAATGTAPDTGTHGTLQPAGPGGATPPTSRPSPATT